MFVQRNFLVVLLFSSIQCDITNVKEFLDFIKSKGTDEYSVGALSQANIDVAKRSLTGKPKFILYEDKKHLLDALQNRTIVRKFLSFVKTKARTTMFVLVGMGTGIGVQDINDDFHVFSSLTVSPQAMLVAPDYDRVSAPYGLQDHSSADLFNALNAAIIDMQNGDEDETIFTNFSRNDVVRSYSCRQDSPLSVPNRNSTTGFLREILDDTRPLRIGGIGPRDWGIHDGNYSSNNPRGIYPSLLDTIVDKLAKLKGSDDIPYSKKISFTRKYFPSTDALLRALLDKEIDVTDVYILIDAPYIGSQANCSNSNHNACRTEETCLDSKCSLSPRPRSLMFRSTCTVASRDTKFITLKENGKVIRRHVSILKNKTSLFSFIF